MQALFQELIYMEKFKGPNIWKKILALLDHYYYFFLGFLLAKIKCSILSVCCSNQYAACRI